MPFSHNNFQDRLKSLMASRNLTQAQLAKEIGSTQSTVQQWLGGTLPRKLSIQALASRFKVRQQWLLTGEEPMNYPNDTNSAEDALYVNEETASYIVQQKSKSRQMYLSLMIAILQEVQSGKRPEEDLEEVHALLDLAHPMPTKEDTTS